MRVLVAEDDRQMSQLLCAMLRSAGHQPTPVFDGASTLMAAMRTPAPDLVVLDLAMPAGTGQETLMKLKRSSRTNQIPVLVVSASLDAKAHDDVLALGANAYLEKPVSPDNFIAAVEAFGAGR
jgi:DNA-binding response OmpR family regulator